MNQGAAIPTVTLSADQAAPTIQASLSNDTGRSNTDGITNDLAATINGSISDNGTIASFTASIDGSTAVELGTLLGQNFATGGNFSLNLARLETIAGTGAGSLTNDGPHTLTLTVRDDKGNITTPPVQVSFTFDTVAPTAPTGLDLDAASDSGSSNTDNITNDTTPTIAGTADANARVQLFSSLVTGNIGQMDVTTGAFSITPATALAAGTHSITATATDLAGNVSTASTALSVVIDTTPPTTPTLTLDPGSDTGTVGDNLTTNTIVTLQGVTEANASLTLRRAGTVLATATANGSGAFSFTQVTLPFGAAQFEVTAADAAGATSTFTRTITRNNAPVATDATFTLAEESAVDTVVGTVSASDTNSTEGDTLTYAITGGNTSNAFAINPTTGQIRVANPAAVDFETTPTFTLTVTVTDSGGNGSGTAGTGLTDTATITINLTDGNDAPNITNQTFQIAENSANGTSVGTVLATDPNAGNTVTFAITGGNTNNAFAIDANTGQITVASAAALNFEATPSFSLIVSATDNLGLSRTATITVNVQNVNEAPTLNEQTFNVPANATAGQAVGNMTATDPDANETFTFVVLESTAPFGLFSVSVPGNIAISNPALLAPGSTYTLTVRVTDKAGAGLDDVGTITIVIGSTSAAPVAVGDVFQLTQGNTNIGPDRAGQRYRSRSRSNANVTGVGATESGGTATIGTNGQTIVYTPPTGFIGADRFTYTVGDGQGGTATSMVTVQVMAPMPALNASFQANLSIFINGERRPNPPANIGVMSPGASQTLLAPIHTEAADGRIHIEPTTSGPPTQSVTVNDFFTTWRTNAGAAGNNANAIFTANQVLDHVRASDEVVRMYVNGLPMDRARQPHHPPRRPDRHQRGENRRRQPAQLRADCRSNRARRFAAHHSARRLRSEQHVARFHGHQRQHQRRHHADSREQSQHGADRAELRAAFLRAARRPRAGHHLADDRAGQQRRARQHAAPPHHQRLRVPGLGSNRHRLRPPRPGELRRPVPRRPAAQQLGLVVDGQRSATTPTRRRSSARTSIPRRTRTVSTFLRRLDFNHSIFAKQTSGENVRRLIMPVPTGSRTTDQSTTLSCRTWRFARSATRPCSCSRLRRARPARPTSRSRPAMRKGTSSVRQSR